MVASFMNCEPRRKAPVGGVLRSSLAVTQMPVGAPGCPADTEMLGIL
jgi:hypothetical protein